MLFVIDADYVDLCKAAETHVMLTYVDAKPVRAEPMPAIKLSM